MGKLRLFFTKHRIKVSAVLFALLLTWLFFRFTGGSPFLMKKVLSRLLFPLPVLSLLFAAGVLLLYSGSEKKRKAGRILVTAGTVLFLAAGIAGGAFLARYQMKYAPWPGPSGKKEMHTVCVFGCGWRGSSLRPERKMVPEMLCRMYEGALTALELEKKGYPYQILSSPSRGYSRKEQEEAFRKFYSLFGIPPEKVILTEQKSRDTRDEVKLFRKYPGKKLFVSSPRHLPRIMHLAEKYGTEGIPVPAVADIKPSVGSPLPTADRMRGFERFIYETLGQAEVQFLMNGEKPPPR